MQNSRDFRTTSLVLALGCVQCGASVSPATRAPSADSSVDASPDAPPDASVFSASARLIAPMSTALVTTQRPTLRWQLGAEATGSEIELCRDRAMTRGCQRSTVDRAQTSLAVDAPLDAGRWFWRVRALRGETRSSELSAVWELHVPSRSTARDASWGATANFNGDAFDDVAVGVTGDSAMPRRIEVFYGREQGISATPSLTLREGTDAVFFARSFANASDVNGDGFTDLIVAVPTDGPTQGRFVAYYGGLMGLSATPQWAVTLSAGAFVSGFSRSVAGLGDVNADGYADVAVAIQPAQRTERRVIEVYRGSSSGLGASPAQRINIDAVPHSVVDVAAAGDLNGDGFADLAVSVKSAIIGQPNENYVAIYLGSAGGFSARPSARIESPFAPDLAFGTFVACGGDLNGDGFADLLVDGLVYAGSASGIETTARYDAQPRRQLRGPAGAAGDFDGDGITDMLSALQPGLPLDIGAAVLRSDSNLQFTVIGSLTQVILQPTPSLAQFDSQLASLGDINGDGRSDVALLGYAIVPDVQARLLLGIFSQGSMTLVQRHDWSFGPAPTSSTRSVPLVVGAVGQ